MKLIYIIAILLYSTNIAHCNYFKTKTIIINDIHFNFIDGFIFNKTFCNNARYDKYQYSKIINLWKNKGTELIKEMYHLFPNIKNNVTNVDITLVSCDVSKIGAISHPLIFNIQNNLNDNEIVAIIFHEYLHRYIMDNFNFHKLQSLQNDFKEENEVTKYHIHLVAIQNEIYRRLNIIHVINDINNGYINKRANEIVEKYNNLHFINELKVSH